MRIRGLAMMMMHTLTPVTGASQCPRTQSSGSAFRLPPSIPSLQYRVIPDLIGVISASLRDITLRSRQGSFSSDICDLNGHALINGHIGAAIVAVVALRREAHGICSALRSRAGKSSHALRCAWCRGNVFWELKASFSTPGLAVSGQEPGECVVGVFLAMRNASTPFICDG
jgi:hypothetical protein